MGDKYEMNQGGVVNQPPAYPAMYPSAGYGQTTTNTTVVINQPNQNVPVTRDWSSGMCACFEDMASCCLTLFFPWCYLGCCLYGRFNETCCTVWCVPASDMALRIQHRNRQKIEGSVLKDCCMSYWCSQLSICQLKRDMDFTESQGLSLNFQ